MKNSRKLQSIALILSVLFCVQVLAEKQHPRKPPKEAVEACENKAEGENVSFVSPRGDTLEATCHLMKAMLIAVPTDKHQHADKEKGDKHEH